MYLFLYNFSFYLPSLWFLVEFNAIKDDASICSSCTYNFCVSTISKLDRKIFNIYLCSKTKSKWIDVQWHDFNNLCRFFLYFFSVSLPFSNKSMYCNPYHIYISLSLSTHTRFIYITLLFFSDKQWTWRCPVCVPPPYTHPGRETDELAPGLMPVSGVNKRNCSFIM